MAIRRADFHHAKASSRNSNSKYTKPQLRMLRPLFLSADASRGYPRKTVLILNR
jgi:hypothetical protein